MTCTSFVCSSVGFIRCVVMGWLSVGDVISLLHVQIASGWIEETVYVVHVLVNLVASVAMLVFKVVIRS